jgi:F0F1-type ATP synthase beta subunit
VQSEPLEDGTETIVEVQQLLGDNKVRAVSMRSTDSVVLKLLI